MKPKISVIIPVFKVEKFIERCARSLFEQTLLELEYIFVNDNTPDTSVQILKSVLKEYPQRSSQVRIIELDQNMGVAFVRNLGLSYATGDYIIQFDSDDWAESTQMEELYVNAVNTDSDLLWSDFFVNYADNELHQHYRTQYLDNDTESCIKALLNGNLHGATWNKLIKRSFCVTNNIRFPQGITMCEDLVFIICCLLKTPKINYLPKAHYHYVQHANSITQKRTLESFESEFKVVDILSELLIDEKFQSSLLVIKSRIKKDMLFLGSFKNQEFVSCFPECDGLLFKGLHGPKGFIDKLAIWFALQKNYSISNFLIASGHFYIRLKYLITRK